MKRLLLWLCLLLLLCQPALGELAYSWREGQAHFPEGEGWRYQYSYRYPLIAGDSFAAQAINEYFAVALNEQLQLVLPMYANDPIMTEAGQQLIADSYQVTLNDKRLFSVLLKHEQSLGEGSMLSLHSVVFAVSGEYMGESLTLRGVCGVGDSSVQLGEAVLKDVWRKVAQDMAAHPEAWQPALDFQRFSEGFFPQTQFYAEKDERVVFYLQPGEFRQDRELITFSYSYQELEQLLK